MAIRRFFSRRKREVCRDIWPIDESAGRTPEGWPGWPDGKKFAFVLTHDVEGPDGLEKCRRLAELEMELGFRSSFNFIPEGGYTVPPDLRQWLKGHGFEVGIHDLHHDGKLFDSRRGFETKAKRINDYLREWGAVGFRAGFMLRNLDWYHDLNIEYDASTFDTDPFEPQPDGMGTIFPFWVAAPEGAPQSPHSPTPSSLSRHSSRSDGGPTSSPHSPTPSLPAAPRPRNGYVELPYTLPQDSTLFFLLHEKTPEIWLRKLDWVAARGGMAMVIVHPDYLRLDGEKPAAHMFSADLYTELLRYASRKYPAQIWNPLPSELAGWYKGLPQVRSGPATALPAVDRHENQPADGATGLRGKRAAVLLYSYYPTDPRPRRAAETMIEMGMEVDLLCLSETENELPEERVGGVNVFRLPMTRRRDSKWTYLRQYGRFLASAFWFLARRDLRRRYDLVHVHNMPDMLVFSALVPKLRGAKIILDLHDPMPELVRTIYGFSADSAKVSLLKRLEKWSIGFADVVLTVNETCKKLFSARSSPSGKIHVIMNSPDERIFQYREPPTGDTAVPAADGRFVIMYHGSLVERLGLHLAVDALGRIKRSIPGAELRIYGSRTPYLDQVMKSVQDSDLRDVVHYFGAKNLQQIVAAIGACDVGVIPNRRSIFTEINTPTRIFEHLSQGKPVIAPRSPGILDYFGPEDLVYFNLGDAADLAEKLEYVYRHRDAVRDTVKRGQAVYQNHRWSSERGRLVHLLAHTLGVSARAGEREPSFDTTMAGGGK